MLRRKSSKAKKAKTPKAKKVKAPKAKKTKAPKSKKEKVAASEGVVVAKPGFNIYTSMLLVALLSLCIGCIVLGLEWQRFGR